jgi:hypothetical protein
MAVPPSSRTGPPRFLTLNVLESLLAPLATVSKLNALPRDHVSIAKVEDLIVYRLKEKESLAAIARSTELNAIADAHVKIASYAPVHATICFSMQT